MKLEFVGEGYYHYRAVTQYVDPATERYAKFLGQDHSRPWVARITGYDDHFGFARRFIRGSINYTEADSSGNRGVYLYFFLWNGIYEVNERISWKNVRRYFIKVDGPRITEITREEVSQWIRE